MRWAQGLALSRQPSFSCRRRVKIPAKEPKRKRSKGGIQKNCPSSDCRGNLCSGLVQVWQPSNFVAYPEKELPVSGQLMFNPLKMKRSFSNLSRPARVMAGSLIVLLLLHSQEAAAQDWAKPRVEKSPRHHEYVDIKSGDRTIKASVVYPESKDKTPVVLVIHEIFGLTDWVKS